MASEDSNYIWQSYLLQGRPDFVNYIHTGDVTWPQVWEALDDLDESDTAVLLKACRFFFAFNSWEFDEMGCAMDLDSELAEHVGSWARFAVRRRGALPEPALQATLRELISLGVASPQFYELVYEYYGEALAELAANRWPKPLQMPARAEVAGGQPAEDTLPWCEITITRVSEAAPEDPRWREYYQQLLDRHRLSWSQGYADIARNLEVLAEDRAAL